MGRSKKAHITEADWVSVKVDIAEIKKDVSYIRRVLDGNGRGGLEKRVADLEKQMTKIMTIAAAAGTVIGIVVNTVLKKFGL